MILGSDNICVEIDSKTGETKRISSPRDEQPVNWIIENSGWGAIDGFSVLSSSVSGERAETVCIRDNLRVLAEKKLTEQGYTERYSVTNTGSTEFFLTKENFGIRFPYQCSYSPDADFFKNANINHIWCGGDVCWIYSVRLNGKPPYLVMNMTAGSAPDYSISYDISKARVGAHYRGALVLHTAEQVILPNETVQYEFLYRFCNEKPELQPLCPEAPLRFTADKYTLHINEKLNFIAETYRPFHNATVSCGGEILCCGNDSTAVSGSCTFDETGEKKLIAEIDGKKTWIFVNVLADTDEILHKRARFIAEKQQYHRSGSHLDGAYLIYDSETDSLYCDSTEYPDRNAARERIGMGVLVCRALQRKHNERLLNSLIKHRAFIEREIFDADTGMVFNNVCREQKHARIFNFPWISVYYLEWYNLNGERKCIENAAAVLMKFFELAEYKYPAQCIEAVKICDALKKEGLDDLRKKFLRAFLMYVDGSSQLGFADMECTWCSEAPGNHLSYQSQAYILTHDEKYLKLAENSLPMLEAFFARQPDFHLNCIPVRYWDRYWFGKHRSYGDLFPHYWSILAGRALAWYDKAADTSVHRKTIYANLGGNLCIYADDGFAANNYLYPYKITLYSSDPNYENEYMKPGITYGKNYDVWANDQDWALYYASVLSDDL